MAGAEKVRYVLLFSQFGGARHSARYRNPCWARDGADLKKYFHIVPKCIYIGEPEQQIRETGRFFDATIYCSAVPQHQREIHQ